VRSLTDAGKFLTSKPSQSTRLPRHSTSGTGCAALGMPSALRADRPRKVSTASDRCCGAPHSKAPAGIYLPAAAAADRCSSLPTGNGRDRYSERRRPCRVTTWRRRHRNGDKTQSSVSMLGAQLSVSVHLQCSPHRTQASTDRMLYACPLVGPVVPPQHGSAVAPRAD
jgi:hypothetical protein